MNENADSAESRDDPWLTLAEIADELRVNPATVRLWVRKGQLEATRAGMRKLIVRRSELERMLASVNPAGGTAVEDSPAPRASDLGPDASDAPLETDGSRVRLCRRLGRVRVLSGWLSMRMTVSRGLLRPVLWRHRVLVIRIGCARSPMGLSISGLRCCTRRERPRLGGVVVMIGVRDTCRTRSALAATVLSARACGTGSMRSSADSVKR